MADKRDALSAQEAFAARMLAQDAALAATIKAEEAAAAQAEIDAMFAVIKVPESVPSPETQDVLTPAIPTSKGFLRDSIAPATNALRTRQEVLDAAIGDTNLKRQFDAQTTDSQN